MRFRDAGDAAQVDEADHQPQDLDLIVVRLAWTPAERLRHLLEMLAFEERARTAHPLGPLHPKETEPNR
jgi:hypothetical protein